jgi:hypothetical protein
VRRATRLAYQNLTVCPTSSFARSNVMMAAMARSIRRVLFFDSFVIRTPRACRGQKLRSLLRLAAPAELAVSQIGAIAFLEGPNEPPPANRSR